MKFRSKLEEKFYKDYKNDIQGYEQEKISYTLPHTYLPDFKVAHKVYIETKGRFYTQDRTKTLAVLRQHPDVTIALVFMKPHTPLYKGAKTTNADWCDKYQIPWFDINDKEGIGNFIAQAKVPTK